jgi:predicted nuclease of predicted toxin-antitoxin system
VVVWVDAQISPALADWMRRSLGVDAHAVRDLGLRNAEDPVIFAAARAAGAVVLTKDSDYLACSPGTVPRRRSSG